MIRENVMFATLVEPFIISTHAMWLAASQSIVIKFYCAVGLLNLGMAFGHCRLALWSLVKAPALEQLEKHKRKQVP
jgi:hypothetical protein